MTSSISSRNRSLKTMGTMSLDREICARVRGFEALQITVHALDIAVAAHQGQFRNPRGDAKSRDPYINHPLRVALRLLRYGVVDTGVINAALLHDAVEDGSYVVSALDNYAPSDDPAVRREEAFAVLSRRFSSGTVDTIRKVTNPLKVPGAASLTVEEKHEQYRAHVLDQVIGGEPFAFAVKFSDFVDNAGSLHHHADTHPAMVRNGAYKYLPLAADFEAELEDHRVERLFSYDGAAQAKRALTLARKHMIDIITKEPDENGTK